MTYSIFQNWQAVSLKKKHVHNIITLYISLISVEMLLICFKLLHMLMEDSQFFITANVLFNIAKSYNQNRIIYDYTFVTQNIGILIQRPPGIPGFMNMFLTLISKIIKLFNITFLASLLHFWKRVWETLMINKLSFLLQTFTLKVTVVLVNE